MPFWVTITRGSDGRVLGGAWDVGYWSGSNLSATEDSYTITIKRADTNSGNQSYTITNAVVPAPSSDPITLGNDGEGGAMANEQPHSGSISYGDLDVYWFNANASDPGLYVEMDYSGSARPNLTLIGPNAGESDNCGVPVAGTGQYNCSFYNNLAGTIYAIVWPPTTQVPNPVTVGYTLTLHNSTAEPAGQVGKSLGGGETGRTCGCAASPEPDATGNTMVGEPINPSNGNMFDLVVDYTTTGQNPLALIRYYNSAASLETSSFASSLGVNWRTNYDRYLHLLSSSMVTAERPDGRVLTFRLTGGAWKPDTDIQYTLTNSGTTWTLTDNDYSVETYTAISATQAQLTKIATPAGYVQTLAYSGGQLGSVTDSYNRKLSFTYTGSNLIEVTTPDTLKLTYEFATATGKSRLESVGYNTSPATGQTYLYEDASLPYALTGVTDENGARYATWAYDTQGRAISSELAGGAGSTTISYAPDGMSSTVTNPLGLEETYKFKPLQDVAKIIEIDRHDPSGSVPDASETFTYDANGYLSGAVDWNGNSTIYQNNANGTVYRKYEVYGSSVARTTSYAYDSHWPLKVATITVGGIVTQFTYDATAGTLLTKKITDETSGHGTFAPASETWTYTYNTTGQLLTEQKPRTDQAVKTTYGYTGGTLTSVTNPLNQVTTISSYTPGGRPLTVKDPNGVVTTLTNTPRNWLKTSSVATSGGARVTTFGFDNAGNLTSQQQPGGATLAYTYDNAHRLTKITDLLGQTRSYTLDARGDITKETIANASGTTKFSQSNTFDALGRRLNHTGGASQKTQFAYDGNGNVTRITDPLGHATVQTIDALNRVSQITDRASGLTKITYDYADRPSTVTTPNGAKTTYYFNAYGSLIEQVSPDSGTSYYYYDGDGNLTKTQNALNIIANNTYDALDRRTGIAYPASTTENVTYTYDQAGRGFGIGRLTSMTDQAGTFTRNYDERGNITSEAHSHGSYSLNNSYSYDAAGMVTSQAYPDGMILTQVRDTMERINGLTLKPSSSGASQTVLSSVTWQPFGPAAGFTYGSGIADARTFDGDYRITKVADTGTAAVQNLTYVLDANDNVKGITDAVTAANSQTLTYDALDRLLTAKGGYGSESFGYDANGNRKTLNGIAWNYAANTNRLTAMGTTAVSTNGNGNVMTIAYSAPMSFTYNNANRLATVTKSGSTVLSYLYDGFGQRIGKTDTAQRFVAYDQFGRYVEETDNIVTTKLDYIYLDGLPVATFVPNGGTGTLSFLHTDRLGTPRLATNAAKAIGWSMAAADPFGAPNGLTGNSIANDLRFPGQEYELASGHNHNGWRDYSPGLGRYLESDPIGLKGGQASTYAYAGLTPQRFTDPSGLDISINVPVGKMYGPPLPNPATMAGGSGSPLYGPPEPYGPQASPGQIRTSPPNVDCPATAQECADDPDFHPYPGVQGFYHCNEQGFEQSEAPAGHEIQECFYQPNGKLDTGWCGGSPDQYDVRTNFWAHTLLDKGGPNSPAGWRGFGMSRWRDVFPAAY